MKPRSASFVEAGIVGVTAATLGAAGGWPASIALADPVPERRIGDRARSTAQEIRSLKPTGDDADLEPIRRLGGNAHVVSFGEGLHGSAEPLEFRNRLFRFLVEKMGFSAIAIESGIVEGFLVNRYVLIGAGTLDEVMARGFDFGFGQLPQQRELIQWMREYNADPRHAHKVSFHGIDVSGSPEHAQQPLFDALAYLATRDQPGAAALRARIADLEPMLNLDRSSDRPGQYTALDQAQRDRLTGAIADLIAALDLLEPVPPASSHDAAFVVAHQTAIAARQADDYLRRLPIGWNIKKDGPTGLAGTVASADRTKADNIQWIRDQLGPDGRLLLFAHRDHLAPIRSIIRLPAPIGLWELPPMVGMYLRPRYGGDLVTIGHFFARDDSHCGVPPVVADAASLEGQLLAVPHEYYLLNLRAAPDALKEQLRQPRELFGVPPLNTASVGDGYDAILFTRSASPAISCATDGGHGPRAVQRPLTRHGSERWDRSGATVTVS